MHCCGKQFHYYLLKFSQSCSNPIVHLKDTILLLAKDSSSTFAPFLLNQPLNPRCCILEGGMRLDCFPLSLGGIHLADIFILTTT
uniref:Uncharacterized protein n=1 Tax=Pyxicephalus adspersus TaxID=30357 RepID=A0AAV2ZZ98_PYXAD|nr:TPA: hypothetical protein GDO54_017424 [Pyxicephalus adspersus]